MGGWCSMDLRERVVAAYEKGGVTEAEVAAVFSVGEASVRRWRRRKRETGSVAPRPRSGGMPPAVHEDEHDLLRAIVAEMPDLTNTELTEEFRSRTGRVDVSRSATGRTVLALELTRKKRH